MGAPGVEELKWLRPVRPGDTLRARRTVLESKTSRSRPETGFVKFHYELLNQKDEVVLGQMNWAMLGRRGRVARGSPRVRPGGRKAPAAPAGDPPSGEGEPAPFFEEVPVGETAVLGSYAFTAQNIVASRGNTIRSPSMSIPRPRRRASSAD